MKKTIILAAAIVFLTCSLSAGERRLTRKLPTPKAPKTEAVSIGEGSVFDKSSTLLDSLSIKGYDKPVDTSSETIFITNSSSRHLCSITLKLTYTDMSGEQLHSREVVIACDIPSGETRKADFPTWDRQRSFYYYGSRAPKRRKATPYRITAELTSATLLP